MTNSLPHFWLIVRKVLQAISWTPSKDSFINSKSFLMTVLRKFQLVLRNFGY